MKWCSAFAPGPGGSTCGTRPTGFRHSQFGQAIAETLVLMLVLAVLWVAIPWLAHLQDIALSATHASRHAAFLATRAEHVVDPDIMVRGYFTGPAHRWVGRRSERVLDPVLPVSLSTRRPKLSPGAQPGGTQPHATVLRQEWGLEDNGIFQARITANFQEDASSNGKRQAHGLLSLDAFDNAYPSFSMSMSILTGAGHAESDDQAQAITGSSALAWSDAEADSARAGEFVVSRAGAVDAGWGRAGPEFDWLARWASQLPEYLLVD